MQAVGVGLRAVAVILDTILLGFVAYLIARYTGGVTETGFTLQGGPFFLWLLIALIYYIVMEARWGATVGKKLIALRVVKEDGSALDWQAAIVRNLLRIVDGLFFYLVAAIFVWASDKNQRLGDRLAGTLVVRA